MSEMPHHHMVEDHSERIGVLEADMTSLKSSVADISHRTQVLGQQLGEVNSSMKELVAVNRVQRGTFSINTILPVLAVVGAFAAYMIGVHLNPLVSRVNDLSTDTSVRFNQLRDELSTISRDSPSLHTKVVLLEREDMAHREALDEIKRRLDKTEAEQDRRLHEEAAIGRSVTRGK